MAAKKKVEEVTIEEGKNHTSEVTDLEIFIGEKNIGRIFQEKDDRQIQLIYKTGRKGSAVSIEEGVRSIIADYNLHG